MNVDELVPGRLYRLVTGEIVQFAYFGSGGRPVVHPPGEPDMQSSHSISPQRIHREATPEEALLASQGLAGTDTEISLGIIAGPPSNLTLDGGQGQGFVTMDSGITWKPIETDVGPKLDAMNALLARLLALPPEGLGFLRACLEVPSDRSLWLVLADWLAEREQDEAARKLRVLARKEQAT